MKNKKVLIVLIIATVVILVQKLDLDLALKNKLYPGQVAGIAQKNTQASDTDLKINFFDIGEADSIFIELPTAKQILIDGGEEDGQALKKINKIMDSDDHYIDLVISTHPHADHLGGLIEILKTYQVGQVWLTGVVYSSSTYLNFLNLLKEKNISTRIIYSCGLNSTDFNYTVLDINNLDALDKQHCLDELFIDSTTNLRILHPLENLKDKKIDNVNNSSIVVKLNFGQNSFMFMGDAETPSEQRILATFAPIILKTDVLKVAHQGSSDASSQEFLQTVQPDYAVILTGKDNSYGHPSLRIIRRLERLGVKILRTDQDGDIEFIVDQTGLKLE